MKKVCFIIPYFGKFPNYFQLFLQSCAKNTDYQWLIFTDDNTEFNYPQNVKRILMSFSDLQHLVSEKFEFQVSLDTPRKLCDYKPAYGYIFENYLSNYEYWGHCDTDIIVGNLNNFLLPLLTKNYDKIFTLGHFIIYKNNYENNRRFMRKVKGRLLYKESFTNKNITTFDETYGNDENVNTVFLQNEGKVFQDDYSFNTKLDESFFIQTKYNSNKKIYENIFQSSKLVLGWDSSGLFTIYNVKDKFILEEVMYVHLQQRKMKIKSDLQYNKPFIIIPNSFYSVENLPKNIDEFKKIKKKTLNFQRIRIFVKWKWFGLKKKMLKLYKI